MGVGVGVGVGTGVGLGVGVGDGAQAVTRRRAVNASANKQRLQCRILIFHPSLDRNFRGRALTIYCITGVNMFSEV